MNFYGKSYSNVKNSLQILYVQIARLHQIKYVILTEFEIKISLKYILCLIYLIQYLMFNNKNTKH